MNMDGLRSFTDAVSQAVPGELAYLLRRAEQESIAAIRSTDPRVADPHAQMACVYSAQAQSLLTGDAI